METNRICAWCKKPLPPVEGIVDGIEEGFITHGMCEECEAKFNKEVDSLGANEWTKEACLASFNLHVFSGKKLSDNQLINNVVVNILFRVSGRPCDINEAYENIRELRLRGSENIGSKILDRLNESFDATHTLWSKLPDEAQEKIRQEFRSELVSLMNAVLANVG